jgi:bacteriorhodopsin
VNVQEYAALRTAEVSMVYGKVAWLSIIVWICYPVTWLFSTGFASFSVSFEVNISRPLLQQRLCERALTAV